MMWPPRNLDCSSLSLKMHLRTSLIGRQIIYPCRRAPILRHGGVATICREQAQAVQERRRRVLTGLIGFPRFHPLIPGNQTVDEHDLLAIEREETGTGVVAG